MEANFSVPLFEMLSEESKRLLESAGMNRLNSITMTSFTDGKDYEVEIQHKGKEQVLVCTEVKAKEKNEHSNA